MTENHTHIEVWKVSFPNFTQVEICESLFILSHKSKSVKFSFWDHSSRNLIVTVNVRDPHMSAYQKEQTLQ